MRVCKGSRLIKEVQVRSAGIMPIILSLHPAVLDSVRASTSRSQEALPIVHAAKNHIESLPHASGAITLVDLCSGFGYLSMLLADILPRTRIQRILLVDRSWPLPAGAALPQDQREPLPDQPQGERERNTCTNSSRDRHISRQHLNPDLGWGVPLVTVGSRGEAGGRGRRERWM